MLKCQICKTPLQKGNPKNIYGTQKGMKHLSKHHLFPKRFKKYFTELEIKKEFQIDYDLDACGLCYECHEEMLHNVILNRKMINKLSLLLAGKNKKDKIRLFYQILKRGICGYKSKP